MIPGIEGIHAWTSPGADEPAIELGRIKADDGSPVWPRYRIRRISGLRSLGDPEDNRDRPPRRALEVPRLSQRRGKTITYEGAIQARTLMELREAEDALLAAFDALDTEGRMDAFWHPLLDTFAELPAVFYEARALTCDVIDVQEEMQWERLYVVGLRAADRRYFDEETEAHEVTISDLATNYNFE